MNPFQCPHLHPRHRDLPVLRHLHHGHHHHVQHRAGSGRSRAGGQLQVIRAAFFFSLTVPVTQPFLFLQKPRPDVLRLCVHGHFRGGDGSEGRKDDFFIATPG